jgi:hypothetical protein
MSRVVPQGPWTEPLNWNLHTTHEGEICVPFPLHVQPEITNQATSSFPQFVRLPVELQLYIVRLCDRPVLFQLMQVSSAMRKDSQKLFWSDPETWYFIRGEWLLAGGFSGRTLNAMDAFAYMQRIEVDFGASGPLEFYAWRDGMRRYNKQSPDNVWDQHIHDFWRTLQHRFPSVTEVVLSQTYGEIAGAPVPNEFGILAGKCPAGIRTSISCLQEEVDYYKRLKRILWQQVCTSDGMPAAWEVANVSWTRTSVLPPPKTFRGPVGAFCRIRYHASLQSYRHWACRFLFIYAIEAHHQQEKQTPYTCLASDCDLQFEVPGQWAAHAIDSEHDRKITLPDKQLRALFHSHVERVSEMKQQYPEALARMQIEWGKEGSEQRSKAESVFLSQLQHDPLYTQDKSPEESEIWLSYKRAMNNELWLG